MLQTVAEPEPNYYFYLNNTNLVISFEYYALLYIQILKDPLV